MYFEFNKEIAINEYPFLEEESYYIINFISLDAVTQSGFQFSLYSIFEGCHKKILNLVFEQKINAGNIIPFTQFKPKNILSIPYKDRYSYDIDKNYLIQGLNKLSSLYKNGTIREVIIVEEQGVTKDMIEKLSLEIELPNIIYK